MIKSVETAVARKMVGKYIFGKKRNDDEDDEENDEDEDEEEIKENDSVADYDDSLWFCYPV